MDNKSLYKGSKKLENLEKMERFEALEDNEIRIESKGEKIEETAYGGKAKSFRQRLRYYNILQETDFEEKNWDYEDLVKEQKALRSLEKEERFAKFRNSWEDKAAELGAKRYSLVSTKDRKKAYAKYYNIINEDIYLLTDEYNRKKNKLSAKEKLKYEKKIIELNAKAREQYIIASQEYKVDMHHEMRPVEAAYMEKAKKAHEDALAKNEVRKDYRLLRMYYMHMQDKSLSAKEKDKLKAEFNKIKLRLTEEAQKIWGSAVNDEDFDWAKAIGSYSITEVDSSQTRNLKKREIERQQENRDLKEFKNENDAEIELIKKEFFRKSQQKDEIGQLLDQDSLVNKLSKLRETENQRSRVKMTMPAWEHYIETGIWDPGIKAKDKKKNKKDKDEVGQPAAKEVAEGWWLYNIRDVAMNWARKLAKMGISDEVFVGLMNNYNETYKKNREDFLKDVKEKGGFKKRFLYDYSDYAYHHLYAPDKETKEARKKRHKVRDEAQKLERTLKNLEKLGYPELEEMCEHYYKEIHKKHHTNYIYDAQTAFFALASPLDFKDEDMKEEVDALTEPIKKMAYRLEHLTDILKLEHRGPGIYQSPAIKELIVTDKILEDGVEEALLKQVNDLDKMIYRMAENRFGTFSADIVHEELLKFLGDKALFGERRMVRDLCERFMSGLSLTSVRAARVNADFKAVYKDIMGSNVDPFLDRTIQEYLKRASLPYSSDEDRIRNLKDYLKPVKRFMDIYKKNCDRNSFTKEGWMEAIKGMKLFFQRTGSFKIQNSKEDMEDGLKKHFERVAEADKVRQGERVKYSALWEDEAASQERQRIELKDFSFSGMLKGEDLLESGEIREVVKDQNMRKFLADNLSDVILNNPELQARFPFLKNVQNLDQLENLHFSEFEQLRNYLKGNLTEEGVGRKLKEMLENNADNGTGMLEMKQNVLLAAFRNRTSEEGINRLVSSQLKLHEDKEEVKRYRLYYQACRLDMKRDGKIKMRYEDMVDRKKSVLQWLFGKNASDYAKRIDAFDQATAAWKRLEAVGGPAVKQMKIWIGNALRSKDPKTALENLAKMLMWNDKLTSKEELKEDQELAKQLSFQYEGEFRDELRCAISGLDRDKTQIEKERMPLGKEQEELKIDDVKNFILQMAFCDSQDVLFNHGGKLQGGIFRFYSDDKAYEKWLLEEAQEAFKKVELLDEDLKKYEGNPALKKALRDKLLPTYMISETDVQEQKKKLEKNIKKLQKNYDQSKAVYDEKAKNILDGIRTQLEEIEAEKYRLEKAIESTDISKQSKDYEEKATAYNERRSKAKEEESQYQKDKSKYDEDLQKHKKALKAHEDAKAELEEKRKAANEKLEKAREKYKKKKSTGPEPALDPKFVKLEKKFEEEGAALDEQSKALEEREKELDKTKAHIDEEKNWRSMERKQLDRLSNNIDFWKEELKKNNQKFEQIKKEKQGEADKYGKYEDDLMAKEEEVNIATEELRRLDKSLMSEYYKNSMTYGFNSLDQMVHHLTDAIDVKGNLSNDAKLVVERVEARKKKLEEYGNGELAIFWESFVNNDKIFAELSGESDELAELCIQRLHKQLAPLGVALNEEYSYIAKNYIEDNMDTILDQTGSTEKSKALLEKIGKIRAGIPKELEKIDKDYDQRIEAEYEEEENEADQNEAIELLEKKREEAKEKARRGVEAFWRSELSAYRMNYYNQKKRGNTSIYEKFAEAASAIQQDLAKHMMYEDEGTKRQFETRKAKYRKWWFRTSKNTGVELIAQTHGQTKYQVAMKNAGEIIMNMQDVMLGDEDAMTKMINTGSAKDYYEMLRDRYLQNDELAERRFLHTVLTKERKLKVSDDEKSIEDALAKLDAGAQKDISDLLMLFKKHVEKAAVAMKPEEFSKAIGEYALDYLIKFRNQQRDFAKTKHKQKDAYDKELDKRRKARGEIMTKKSDGLRLLRKKLFGDNWDAMREFGERKQSIVYEPPKEKNAKKVKSKGAEEDKAWLEAARKEFELDEKDKNAKLSEYPDILAVCLDEYTRLNHGYLARIDRKLDKISNWFLSEDEKIKTDINIEADRLKRIYRVASGEIKNENRVMPEIPAEARDMFLAYAARFVDKPENLDMMGQIDAQVIRLAEEFLPYYKKVAELDKLSVKDTYLKHALIDAREKSRSFLFIKKDKTQDDLTKFTEMVDNQMAYFPFADRAYAILEEETHKNKKIALMSEVDQLRFSNAIKEYFTEDILNDALSGVNFDAEKYREEVKKCLSNSYKRSNMLMQSESISSEQYEQQQHMAGEVTEKDFEYALAGTRKKEFLEKYNKLNDTERKIFALSLYCLKDTQTGTQQVVFTPSAAVNKEEREQLLQYLRTGKADFHVDYTRAIRAVTTVHKRTKVSGDSETFNEALRYVERIKKRREELRPRDYTRMNDSYENCIVADKIRMDKVVNKTDDFVQNKKAIDSMKIKDRFDFFNMFDSIAKRDLKCQGTMRIHTKIASKYSDFKNNTGIEKVKNRIDALDSGRKSLLIYILQDRTALDWSTAGKDEKTKIVPHVNAEKRFQIYEKLMSEDGRLEALAAADSPEFVNNAMKTLLSFQLRDDKELGKKLTEDDFNPDSLLREECIDWMLLVNALDFLDEMEREQRRILACRQAALQVTRDKSKKKKPASEFYEKNSTPYTLDAFEDRIHSAFMRDKDKYKDSVRLYRGYMSLKPQQKVLFVKALQHRDLLDVSQRNLYKNILGIAERDFVNRKERDELIDEYIEKSGSEGQAFELGDATYGMAMLSLLSTQVNDDMAFEKIDGSNWAYKNLNVNNQLLVTGSRDNYTVDWKLFERALQLVNRAEMEKKAAAGDEALYKELGDKNGAPMNMDRSYMRQNLHHTGARFLRFLAREGYAQVEDTLGLFDTLAGMAEFVVSTKTANFLHEQANLFKKEDTGEEEEKKDDGDKEEEEDKDKEAKEEKKVTGFLQHLAHITTSAYDSYQKLSELKDEVKEKYSDYKGTFIENEAEKQEKEKQKKAEEEEKAKRQTELDKELGDFKIPKEAKFLDTVKNYTNKAASFKEMANTYLKDKPENLEMVDKYVEKFFGGKIGAQTLGEWYVAADDWVTGLDDKMFAGMPEGLKNALDNILDGMETMGEVVEVVSGYFTSALGILGDFRDMYESYQNIKELNEKKEEAKEQKKEDDTLIAGVDVSEKTRELLKAAQEHNSALLNANNSMVKGIEGRKMVDSGANIVSTALELGGINGLDKAIHVAADFVKFIYKCMSDKKALREYYQKGGNGEVERIMEGDSKMQKRIYSQLNQNGEELEVEKLGKNDFKISDTGLDQLQTGLGFERREEFADYLRLNMVNSLLFSASKYNPLKEPRLLAICALSILGFEDAIGKTDAETAQSIFMKLKD
ncbi:MAG: hypothetical protein IK115_09775 [Lachnospiraceae bacterium]|nr:hypothetical protein [Lachnospiraceae bacterium]